MESGRVGGMVGSSVSGCLMDKTGPESPTQISRPSTGQAALCAAGKCPIKLVLPNNHVCVCVWERCEEV